MRAMALVVALLSVPEFSADYLPWPGRERSSIASEWARSAALQALHQGKPPGNTWVSAKSNCKSPPGCAC